MHAPIDDTTWKQYLSSRLITEGPTEAKKRENVMSLLKSLLIPFSEQYANKQRLRAVPVCQILPFGSYSLGGHLANADIDVVCLAPSTVVERTAVPIIKCSIDSIMTDISFVSLKQPSIPPNIKLLDDGYLEGLDSVCLASMDVDLQHKQVFQQAMQAIKHWATQRCMYGKPMGYLNASPESLTTHGLLQAFFCMWAEWPWPVPVMVTDGIPDKRGQTIPYNPSQETAVMPIITPCYPVSFSAPFTTLSTLKVMTKEFKRASLILDSYFDQSESMLDKLFSEFDIIRPYKHFLKVVVSCETQKSHETWIRKMAVAIPRFVTMLEQNYKSIYEKNALRAGEDSDVAREQSFATALSPGVLLMTWYIIGLEVKIPKNEDRVLDICSEVDDFIRTIDEKRNSKDIDMTVSVVSMKR
ncbi:Poly(A) polymerase central domain-containing protein [Phycomyces blakesleeanus]|uniref:polynucleotide adenylyltransferase n=1 Tax=Phycomyces blakesleeanus TaxID=4837 RepID=A0ABR3AGJ3_PHYBL